MACNLFFCKSDLVPLSKPANRKLDRKKEPRHRKLKNELKKRLNEKRPNWLNKLRKGKRNLPENTKKIKRQKGNGYWLRGAKPFLKLELKNVELLVRLL